MHILCPHCRNPIEIVKLIPHEEIACPSCGSSFRLETESTTGWQPGSDKLGKFDLIEVVGQGAFGTVYKAHDSELDRTVAVKVPRAGNLAGPQELDRFLREARSVAQLRHPSIVSIHEVGQKDGVPYLVSDFVQGVTLADLLSARRPGFRETAQLVAAVADALQYAHEKGVIHRDVKPSNIMIGEDARPCVMDFGLAKRDAGEITMTVEGQVLGTPAYMSPEQAGGEAHKVDGRSDVYSLGVILYQMLTGELPFRGTKRMLLHQVLHDEPKPPRRLNDRIPRDLETICLKAMAKEPSRRYGSAGELAQELRRWLGGQPIQARSVGRLEKAWRWCRRNHALAGTLATLALVLVVGIAVSTFFAVDAANQAKEARQNEATAKTAQTELKQVNADLETTWARSLLRPLGTQAPRPDQQQVPLNDVEIAALNELADRKDQLGYPFLAEALRGPNTTRQLKHRAAYALHAVVGLESERRTQLEKFLLKRLSEGGVEESQRSDLALVATSLGDLTPEAATEVSRILTQAMRKVNDAFTLRELAVGLVVVAEQLQPQEAANVCEDAATILSQAITKNNDPEELQALAEGLGTVALRLDPKDANKAAAALTQAISKANQFTLGPLARGLALVGKRLDAKEASRLRALATDIFIQQMTKATDPRQLRALTQGVATLAAHLERNEAARLCGVAAEILSQAISKTTGVAALAGLVEGIGAVADYLESQKAAAATSLLCQGLSKTTNPFIRRATAEALSSLLDRLEVEEASQVRKFATPIFIKAIGDTTNTDHQRELAQGIMALTGRKERKKAVWPAATAHLFKLAQDQAARAASLSPEEAAEAATVIIRLMSKSERIEDLQPISQGLMAVVVRLSPQGVVDLLKQPLCVGRPRRILLDHIQTRYHRKFVSHWDFVRFSRAQNLGLDFSKPQQPPVIQVRGTKQ